MDPRDLGFVDPSGALALRRPSQAHPFHDIQNKDLFRCPFLSGFAAKHCPFMRNLGDSMVLAGPRGATWTMAFSESEFGSHANHMDRVIRYHRSVVFGPTSKRKTAGCRHKAIVCAAQDFLAKTAASSQTPEEAQLKRLTPGSDELDINAPAISVRNIVKKYKKFVAYVAPPETPGDSQPENGDSWLKRLFSRKSKPKKRVQEVYALNDISFDVKKGEIFGLLGPNSSGKTTLMNILTTLSKPDQGQVAIFGVDGLEHPNLTRNLFGFVAQDAGLDKVLTGREHLNLFGRLAHLSKAERKSNSEQAIKLLQLEPYIDNLTGTYSGGIKKRLDIALALLPRPGILILDEPTASLDTSSRMIIWDILRQYRANGGTVIISTHMLEEADLLADSVAIIDKGVMIQQGKVSDMKKMIAGGRVTIRLQEFTTFEDATRVMSIVKNAGLCTDAIINTAEANSIELYVKSVDDGGAKILQVLRDNGISSYFGFAVNKPSLGDVYLAATGVTLSAADLNNLMGRDQKQMKKEQMR